MKLSVELDGDQAYEVLERVIELVDLLQDVKVLLEAEKENREKSIKSQKKKV